MIDNSRHAVFTIVAKNYLPQARTLGDSLACVHPGLPFFIVLADELGALDPSKERYTLIEIKDAGINDYRDLAFKYDLVEFSTAVKPFIFEHLFERFGFEKIIYLDPDIFVYHRLDPLFDALDDHFMVLTPHITKLNLIDLGTKSEPDLLRNGIYNLGFVAFNAGEAARAVVRWWCIRLRDQGYVDRVDGLFTDQKWMNLVPCFDDKGILVSRNPGCNVAHWNLHEREIIQQPEGCFVNGEPLVFYHFSSFDLEHPDRITRAPGRDKLDPDNMPVCQALCRDYAAKLMANRSEAADVSYAYDHFENGVKIFSLHRRLYRRLAEIGRRYPEPFSTASGSFYDLLRQNKLLILGASGAGEYGKKDFSNAGAKLRILKTCLRLLKKVAGIKYYHLLMRTFAALSRPEEQLFLFETLKLDLPIRFY